MTVFQLWLPILIAGVVVHIISTIAWTVMPHHRPEWVKIPQEDAFQALLKSAGVKPGQYIFPYSDGGKDYSTPEFQAKLKASSGMLVVWTDATNMGKAIGLTLAFFLFITFVIGYLACLGLQPGATFMKVFQFVTTCGLLAHCSAKFPSAFWFRRKVAMDLLDGALYAVATGLIFAALWPSA